MALDAKNMYSTDLDVRAHGERGTQAPLCLPWP